MSVGCLSPLKQCWSARVKNCGAERQNTEYCGEQNKLSAFVDAVRKLLTRTVASESAVLKGVPKHVLNSKKYTSGTLGNRLKNLISLGLNENPIGGRDEPLHQYPERDDASLVAALKAMHGHVRWDECKIGVSFGAGSSQFIEIIPELASKRSFKKFFLGVYRKLFDRAVYSNLTYAAYPQTLVKHGLQCTEVANTHEHGHNLDAMLEAVDKRTSLVLIDNPCNPSGTLLATEKIDDFMQRLNQKPHGPSVWVVLDEAYIEFAEHNLPKEQRNQSLKLLEKYPNLIILRTASKYYGLASMRCGYAMGQSLLLDQIDKFKGACPVSVQAQKAFFQALQTPKKYEDNAVEVVKNRESLIQRVRDAGVLPIESIPDTEASFVLFKLSKNISAEAVRTTLLNASTPIDVKAFSGHNAVRISVNSKAEEMQAAPDAFVTTLRRIEAQQNPAPNVPQETSELAAA